MDKSWINTNRTSAEYINGVQSFLDFAFANTGDSKVIVCPCNRCKVGRNRWFNRDEVAYHLMFYGFWSSYTEWVHHGESFFIQSSLIPQNASHNDSGVGVSFVGNVDTSGLLNDIFGNYNEADVEANDFENAMEIGDSMFGLDDELIDDHHCNGTTHNGENGANAGYRRLVEQVEQELYPKAKYSKLSFILHLLHLKSMHGWPIKSFDMLLQLLVTVFPQINPFPSSWSKCKQLKKDLGLSYEKIHACPNDCILYWDGREHQEECDKCHLSRWKDKDKKLPNKVLRYFPLIPRLLRMYKSSRIAEDMLWHHRDRVKDGILRHPADAKAWKDFDEQNPHFASDPRNVRLGLSSDGFNPFRVMSTTHSTWPVLLIPYNLPPWLCMKQPSIILSMIIPGEKAPGMDIDVYLQPLIKELLQLWNGVDAFDAYTKTNFKMHGVLHSTTSDFPAYANLSGWSTKGRFACPSCARGTHSMWLENGHKFCYMGHRRWLPENHPYRFDDIGFDGKIEFGCAPTTCIGRDVLEQLRGTRFSYEKGESQNVEVDEKDEEQIWKKRSIFFDLPYWEHNPLRHNLDVMHIEKNICDNLLGTLLNLEGKSKDNLKARKDLQLLKIRPELHPIQLANGKYEIPNAPYTLSYEEKTHNREPGPIEWFIETRQNKKDKTFHDPITEQFVDKAKNIIKKKTGSSEVVFSESTFQAEDIAYRKLMGSESHGKVWGLGRGVTVRDMRNMRHQAESPLIMKLMKKMQNLENQVDVLNVKLATQASATHPELSIHSQEASRHNTTRDHYISHNSLLSGNGSHEVSRLDTVHDQYRSNESPKSGDALSISNVLGNQTHELARSSKQGNNPRKTIVSGENHRSPLQHKSSTMVQKVSDEQGTAKQQGQTVMNSLSRAQIDILVSTVVKNHPKEVHQYRSSEKRELIVYYLAGVAMGICKRRAEPNMLDAALREKLDKLTLVMTKSKMHQVGVRNGGT